MVSVGMVNWFFAHYRQAVVEQLDCSDSFEFSWISDSEDSSEARIPTMDMSMVSRWRETRTVRLPGGLRWQKGVLAYALTCSDLVMVYTGDVRFASTWLAALVTRLRGRRVLFWTHGWRSPDRSWRKYLRLTFYRTAHGLLLYGEHARRIALWAGLAPESLYVIGNSMGAPIVWESAATSRDSGAQSWIIVSRLIADRQLGEVVKQAARLTSEGRLVSLVIVGDGPERAPLMLLADQLSYGVTFVGAVYEAASTSSLLGAADICVSPGHVGLAAIHALSSGCPVATHRNANRQMPEYEAIRDGVTGVLFPEGDYYAMAEMAWDFVANHDRAEVAERCHAEIRNSWTADQHAERIRAAITDQVSRLSKRVRASS